MRISCSFVIVAVIALILTESSSVLARSLRRRRNSSECQILYSPLWRWFSYVDTVFGPDDDRQGAVQFQDFMTSNWGINDIQSRQEVRRWACAFAEARSTTDIATALNWTVVKASSVRSSVGNWCSSVLSFQESIYHYQPNELGRRYVTKMFYFCRQAADLEVIRMRAEDTSRTSRTARQAPGIEDNDFHILLLPPGL